MNRVLLTLFILLSFALFAIAQEFVLFEPDEWVEGNEDFKVAAEKLIEVTSSQLAWLKEK